MKKGLWKRRAFAFLVAAAMVIPQGVYAAETGEMKRRKMRLQKKCWKGYMKRVAYWLLTMKEIV